MDGLNVDAIRIENKGPIISRVVFGPEARTAIVDPARGKCCGIKGVNRFSAGRTKRDVQAALHRAAATEPKIWELLVPVSGGADSSIITRELHDPLDAERGQGLFVKPHRSLEVGGAETHMVKRHPTLPSRLIPSSFCASTANSMGSCFSTSRAKPLTISATALSASRPRLIA